MKRLLSMIFLAVILSGCASTGGTNLPEKPLPPMIEKPVPIGSDLLAPATVEDIIFPKFEKATIMGQQVVVLPSHQFDEYEKNKELLIYLNKWAKEAYTAYMQQVELHGDKDKVIGIMIDYNSELGEYSKELEKQVKLRDTEMVVDNVKHTVIETALGVLLVISLL